MVTSEAKTTPAVAPERPNPLAVNGPFKTVPKLKGDEIHSNRVAGDAPNRHPRSSSAPTIPVHNGNNDGSGLFVPPAGNPEQNRMAEMKKAHEVYDPSRRLRVCVES
jgi:hypothetical protein